MTLKDYIVTEEMSLMETMKVIDKNASGNAFVCRDGVLVAAVSDGDVRRSLMRGVDMETPVREIANFHPTFLYQRESRRAMDLMRERSVRALPILDENNRIVDIRFLFNDALLKESQLKAPVVIMAGGKGTRLKPYTDILPKPLIPVGDKTITEHIMENFRKFGCSEFYLIINYKKNLIKAYFTDDIEQEGQKSPVPVHFVEEEKFLGTGGGIALVKDAVKETFFLSNCDILIEADYGEILKKHKEQKNIITIVCAEKNVVVPYGTVELGEMGSVVAFKEKPAFQFYTSTGFYVIEPAFLDRIPVDVHIDITDIIEKCIQNGERVGTYLINEDDWMDMGQLEELEKMREKMGL